MYGFSKFALQLNNLETDMQGNIPPTDSRFRLDQRFLELGKLEQAQAEKERLEQM